MRQWQREMLRLFLCHFLFFKADSTSARKYLGRGNGFGKGVASSSDLIIFLRLGSGVLQTVGVEVWEVFKNTLSHSISSDNPISSSDNTVLPIVSFRLP